jgi:hypothetical protein
MLLCCNCSQALSAATIISLAIIVLAFAVLSHMQESEFQRAFEKQRDALQGSSYGSAYVEGAYEDGNQGLGGLAGMGFGSNMSLILEDSLSALRAMESAIALQEDLLNRDDLLLECEFKVVPHLTNGEDDVGEQLAPTSASAVHQKEQEVASYKLTPHAASLKVNKMLCMALYQAVASGEGGSHCRCIVAPCGVGTCRACYCARDCPCTRSGCTEIHRTVRCCFGNCSAVYVLTWTIIALCLLADHMRLVGTSFSFNKVGTYTSSPAACSVSFNCYDVTCTCVHRVYL